ncbi:hypothetical protein B0H63DRAFT_41140 [Podospora didyma]|uniref:Uncharacterized protein n=1 Tax=Podospora didyma TaxID=330526 RepID=A0AAE0P6J6_9PEZI|nr:hypothetical protein B0H63DRAFT_41140 [Podospora didyma]
MPSRTNSTIIKPAGTVSTKRFELPALEFKFSSLTEGTDIPAPLPSPVAIAVPTPPETPKEEEHKNKGASPSSITSAGGTKRRAEENPSSPTLSSRPGSIRRLFSRNLLNNAYVNGEEGSGAGVDTAAGAAPAAVRPPSRSGSTFSPDGKKTKRSSGWFSRLRSSDSSKPRTGTVTTSPTITEEKKAPTGPPPPMIPELSELKSKVDVQDEGGFGGDLFKDIK